MEHRKPFGLVVNSKKIPSSQQYKINYNCCNKTTSYTFKRSDTNLLIDIDANNATGVEFALTTDKIDVNTRYVIPSWEVPEAGRPMFETFLHRALWANAADVFKLLLEKGADPRIKGHCNSTVIEDLLDGHTPRQSIVHFGKMLVDSGVKAKEIKAVMGEWNEEYETEAQQLIQYAKQKAHCVGHQKVKTPIKNSDRIKD